MAPFRLNCCANLQIWIVQLADLLFFSRSTEKSTVLLLVCGRSDCFSCFRVMIKGPIRLTLSWSILQVLITFLLLDSSIRVDLDNHRTFRVLMLMLSVIFYESFVAFELRDFRSHLILHHHPYWYYLGVVQFLRFSSSSLLATVLAFSMQIW